MDVKQAVAVAKQYVADLYSDEGITSIGLEAIEYDEAQDHWLVTIGFFRSWDTFIPTGGTGGGLLGLGEKSGILRSRSYKVVAISDKGGTVLSIKHRATA